MPQAQSSSHILTGAHLAPMSDMVYQVNQSTYKAVQYPRCVKMIINHVFGTYPNVPKRLNEPYNYLKDDDPILNKFTISIPLLITAMRILDEFLIEDIRNTESYTDYEDDYKSIEVPTIQLHPVVSTQEEAEGC
ncbi:hypothetical protein Tco_0803363 [Tanacetum coccineum]|uniref:Uncharacterized protein n=1 Tax=Tanacetum coccineum TaxID=301880 RepID=A0ABQ5A2B9_9ASTR